MRAAQELFSIGIYSVHIRTRKFRNLAKTKRYVVPAPRANSKTQGGTRIDSDSICHRHHSVFRVFKRSEYTCRRVGENQAANSSKSCAHKRTKNQKLAATIPVHAVPERNTSGAVAPDH